MKKMLTSLFLFTLVATAHEGHDHGPGAVQAPKGGVIRSLETVNLELLNEGKKIKIYIYDTDLKAQDAKKYPVSATITFPKKKAESAQLIEVGDHWETEVNAKNAHRYTLELSIKQGGHDDKVKWVVEPKK